MNYVTYHLHSSLSLLDSCTDFRDYVNRAVELGQKAICFTEHGNIFNWIAKKQYCDEKGIKYLHGVECYLTKQLLPKERDNYHTVLIAKNYDGVLELNNLISKSFQEDHFYYKNRISFDEFRKISDNIVKISACLASPLSKLQDCDSDYDSLVKHYDYLEIQPHMHPDQIGYNKHLLELSRLFNKPLIVGTDTHSLNKYKAECRSILQLAKHIKYSDEDSFDLTYKSYDELVECFEKQNSIPMYEVLEALHNTEVMADSVEEFQLDTSLKYPILYGSRERDSEVYDATLRQKFENKIQNGIIPKEQIESFEAAIEEETRVFEKIDMKGFMLSMSEFVCWCKANNIPVGFGRGSVAGSRVAYVLDITDVNPETWHTVFSRFCNEDRKEVGDIDIDLAPDDREKMYHHIINRFGQDYTAYILAIGTISAKGTIDEIGRALSLRWEEEHEGVSKKESPFSLDKMKEIKNLFDSDEEMAKKKHPEVFYYFDGLLNTPISQSMHPAGILVSPITIPDHYGTLVKDGMVITQIDMEEIHEISAVKYDILGLANVQIIRDTCTLANIPYPKSNEINWLDEKVWEDMLRSPVGIFQFEGGFAYQSLRKFKPQSVPDMALVTAAIRPSGSSYRDRLLAREKNKNPSRILDEMLKDNLGYLIFQEDTIRFLQEICGFSGSAADNIRRAIGRKKKEILDEAMPKILEGYCSKSDKERGVAEKEAKAFLRIIEDSASYQFGYNHAIAYCMISYMCAYLRYYHPCEFITAYLNNAQTDEDIANGASLAKEYRIAMKPPQFGLSTDRYVCDSENNVIAMGVAAVKFLNPKVSKQLFSLGKRKFKSFTELLYRLKDTDLNARQLDILIKIGYFSMFGSIAELLEFVKAFDFFKSGDAKMISKTADNPYLEAVKKFSTSKNKDGSESSRYVITDCRALIEEIETQIRSKGTKDFNWSQKIKWQLEYTGSIQSTGSVRDKWTTYIKEIRPACRKADGVQFGYSVLLQSVGSGKQSYMTIPMRDFNKCPVREGDVIKIKNPDGWERKGRFFNLYKYSVL